MTPFFAAMAMIGMLTVAIGLSWPFGWLLEYGLYRPIDKGMTYLFNFSARAKVYNAQYDEKYGSPFRRK